MSDTVIQDSLNGETLGGVELSGTGERVAQLSSISSSWTNLLVYYEVLLFGPASNPGSLPQLFIGICEAGKPYSDAGANAIGIATTTAASFAWNGTNNNYTCSTAIRTKVGATVTDATSHTDAFGRGDDAVISQPKAFGVGKGTPWTTSKVYYSVGYANCAVLNNSGEDFYKTMSIARLMTGYRDFVNKDMAGAYTSASGGTITGLSGTLDRLNIYWNVPATYSFRLYKIRIVQD